MATHKQTNKQTKTKTKKKEKKGGGERNEMDPSSEQALAEKAK